MSESQVTVDTLLGEHAAIRAHLNIVSGLTRDWKNLLDQRENILQSPDELRSVGEKRSNLRQAMAHLDDGLKKHHIHEDSVFPSLIGEMLMEAIRMEHVEILKLMEKVNYRIANDRIDYFLREGSEVMRMIDEASTLSSSHATREDGILYFLKKLPAAQKGGG
jgi:hypothetical protein